MGAVAALAGCGSHTSGRSVLYGGVSSDAVSRIVHHIGDREAMIAGRANLRLLKRQLQIRARKAPHQVFKNPPQDLLKSALHSEARSNHFRVVSIQMLRPRQLAPKIVVETTHYLALARATPSILVRLDPRRPSADDRKGWAYEGFYFEAEDERNVPFLIVSNFWRGRNGGGGQFARSDALFPYPHG
jgi:hypothetical protein